MSVESTNALPGYRWRFVHLAALWGYGVSQPVFSMLQGNPEFLVINGASRAEAVVFAIVLAFAPPLAVVGLEAVLGAVSSKLASVLHVLAVWLFGATAALQLLKLFEPSSRLAIAIPFVVAYLGAMAYTRWQGLRTFLSVSAILPVVGLIVFVSTAPLALTDAKAEPISVAGEIPVVVVVFDEFGVSSLMRSDGKLDVERYPNFGRLAREGTWYPRATTVHEYTTQAVPAILSGRQPRRGALPTLADHPGSLFTLLGEDYNFVVREPVTRLCPATYCPGHRFSMPLTSRVSGLLRDVGINYLHGSLPEEFRGDVTPLREGWGALVENTGLGVSEFIRSVRRSDPAKSLYFLHTIQPHVPWAMLPSGRQYGASTVVAGLRDDWRPGKLEQWRDEPWLVEQGRQRYLLEVGHVDAFVGDVLAKLDETGIYDDALIVVTADHGVSFRPGGWRRHATEANLADIAAVPLFVKYPQQARTGTDRRAASVIDVLPTIADVLDVDVPWTVDGRSLLGPPVRHEVRLARRDERALVAPAEQVAASVRRDVRAQAASFGEGSASLYRVGPRPELIGREVATLPRQIASGGEVTVAAASELASVDKASGYVPTHLLGRLSWSALRPAETIAVAVNGRIAAVTKSYVSVDEPWFSAMIDEDVLRDGSNGVEVFAVRGAPGAPRLMSLGGTATRAVASRALPRP